MSYRVLVINPGSTSTKFAVYEDEKRYRVYLLNTDLNFELKAKVTYKEEQKEKVIPSVEMDFVDFEK